MERAKRLILVAAVIKRSFHEYFTQVILKAGVVGELQKITEFLQHHQSAEAEEESYFLLLLT